MLVNTTNNSEHQLRQGDLHILLTAAMSEYEKRHWNKQCDTCYKPGLVRREWKPIAGQFAILQLRPASGDQYLPVIEATSINKTTTSYTICEAGEQCSGVRSMP